MDEVTQDQLDKAFPHGATVATQGDSQNFKIVGLEADELDGKAAIFGWAYPNKDIWLVPEDVSVQDDGDWLFHSNGSLVRLSPLTKAQGDAERSMMSEM